MLLNLPLLGGLAGCAREAAQTGEPFIHLSPGEAATTRAFAARIVPSGGDGTGADEAGAVYFIDRALAGPFAWVAGVIGPGLADLDTRARERGVDGFARLAPAQQDEVMREIETTEFFQSARMLTVMGVFSDPSHGGNREQVAERIYGIEHASAYQAPFGYYDAEANAGGAA